MMVAEPLGDWRSSRGGPGPGTSEPGVRRSRSFPVGRSVRGAGAEPPRSTGHGEDLHQGRTDGGRRGWEHERRGPRQGWSL